MTLLVRKVTCGGTLSGRARRGSQRVRARLGVVGARRRGESDGRYVRLRGIVMRGPIRPVCDDPCEEPAAGIVVRFSQGGRVVAW